MNFRNFLLALMLFASVAGNAQAHPVSYQGATALMTWNQPFLADYWIAYSFRSDMAFAARSMRMDMPGGKLWVYMPQYDVLFKRWNNRDSQANIYGYAGFGGVQMNGQRGTAWLTGVEADAESRSLFVMAKAELMDPTIGPNFNHYEFRVGAAPYEAEFNEIASWLMIQIQYHPSLEKKTVVTPLARFFYRSVLFEIGVSTNGDSMTNFMFHF
ncbi:MAG: hypothetical protein H7301_08415 [Cryobacterium sp.]|nr:hypothetical protein [Oligoflexia bacterium]